MNKTPVDLNEGEEAGTDDEDNSSVLDDDSVDEETDDASETPPPPIELPDRLTRGRRLRQVRSSLVPSWGVLVIACCWACGCRPAVSLQLSVREQTSRQS
jgi:hypothetical protein